MLTSWDWVKGRTADLWLLVTGLADISTTAVGIEVFGLVEANGLPAAAMDAVGVWAIVPIKAIVAGIVILNYCWISDRDVPYARHVGMGMVAFVGLLSLVAALWNAHLILLA